MPESNLTLSVLLALMLAVRSGNLTRRNAEVLQQLAAQGHQA